MLVHDIRKNQTSVIDFRETAPSAIREEMMQRNLDVNVRRLSGVLFLIGQNTMLLLLFSSVTNM